MIDLHIILVILFFIVIYQTHFIVIFLLNGMSILLTLLDLTQLNILFIFGVGTSTLVLLQHFNLQ